MGGKPRPIHDRFVVTGQQSRAVAQLGYAHRAEIAFEEQPCLLSCDSAGGKGPAAHVPQGEVHGALLALGRDGPKQRTAARQKRGKGRGVIIHCPPVECAPGNELKLRVGDPQRFQSGRGCLVWLEGAGCELGSWPLRGVTRLGCKAEQQHDRRNARQAVSPAAIPGRAPPRRDHRRDPVTARHGWDRTTSHRKTASPPPCVTGIDCETT